jgi:hypothetical protein
MIIVVVQVGAVKIYVGEVEALRKKERLFCRFFKKFTLCMTKLRVLVLCFSYFTNNSLMHDPKNIISPNLASLTNAHHVENP